MQLPCVHGRCALLDVIVRCFVQHKIKKHSIFVDKFYASNNKLKTQKPFRNQLIEEKEFLFLPLNVAFVLLLLHSFDFINVIGVIWNYRCANGHLKLNPNHHYMLAAQKEKISTRMCKTWSVSVWMIENKKTDTQCNKNYNVCRLKMCLYEYR